MNEQELIRKAMSALGKRTSPAKKRAARANAKLPRKPKSERIAIARKAGSAPKKTRKQTKGK